MAHPAKNNELIEATGLRPGARICDLRSWRRRLYISKRVKELEAENALLARLAAHSEQEIKALREILTGQILG